jgi:hypothetical protein
MSGLRRHGLAALAAAAVPFFSLLASTAAVAMESARRASVTLSSAGQSLSIEVTDIVGPGDLVREIAGKIDARVIVRRDPGTVGPVDINGLLAAEAIRVLSGRHSSALEYRAGRIAPIILVAARDGTTAPRRVVASASRSPTPPPASRQLSGVEIRNQQAKTLRDIVRLSYQHDRVAVDELAGIVASSDDPADTRGGDQRPGQHGRRQGGAAGGHRRPDRPRSPGASAGGPRSLAGRRRQRTAVCRRQT